MRKKRQRRGFPWFRNFDGWWYVTIQGKMRKLAKGKKNQEQAKEEWHRLMTLAEAEEKKDDNPLWVIFEKFLDRTQKKHPGRYKLYRSVLQRFKDEYPDMTVEKLRPKHVTDWMDAHPTWNDSTRSTIVAALVASLNWASKPEERLIDKNPIRGMERPKCASRGEEAVIDPEDFQTVFDAATPYVQDALAFLKQTGTRPGNLARITAQTIDEKNRCVRLHIHKTASKTGRPLVIPLTQAALEILKRLKAKYPSGPLFRTGRGMPMTGERLSSRVYDLKKHLHLKGNPTAYGCRHTMATELLKRDVPDAKVAFVLGWKDTKMLYHHYAHLNTASKMIAEELDRTLNGDADESAIQAG